MHTRRIHIYFIAFYLGVLSFSAMGSDHLGKRDTVLSQRVDFNCFENLSRIKFDHPSRTPLVAKPPAPAKPTTIFGDEPLRRIQLLDAKMNALFGPKSWRVRAGGASFVFMAKDPKTSNKAFKVARQVLSENYPEHFPREQSVNDTLMQSSASEHALASTLHQWTLGSETFQVLEMPRADSDLGDIIPLLKHFEPHDKWEMVKDLTQALNAMHRTGLVHRDLKPDNILVQDRPGQRTPKLLLSDFNLTLKKGNHYPSLMRGTGTDAYSDLGQLRGDLPDLSHDLSALRKIIQEMILERSILDPSLNDHRYSIKVGPLKVSSPQLKPSAETLVKDKILWIVASHPSTDTLTLQALLQLAEPYAKTNDVNGFIDAYSTQVLELQLLSRNPALVARIIAASPTLSARLATMKFKDPLSRTKILEAIAKETPNL